MSAVAMPLFGRLSVRIGLRACLVAGVILICIGSLLAATAPDFALLIIGRAIGGAGAGAMVVSSYATITTSTQPADRSRALSLVAAAGATASGFGPLIGGLITAWPGWRLVLALPAAAALAVPFAARLTPSDRDPSQKIDVRGAILLTIIGTATVLLIQTVTTGLRATITAPLAALGVLTIAVMMRHIRHHPDGYLPRGVLTAPGFLGAGLVGLTVFGGYYAALFAVPTLLHTTTGWGSVAIGTAIFPCTALAVLGARAAPALLFRTTTVLTTTSITAISAAGIAVAALATVPALRILGLGLTTAAFAGGQAVLPELIPRLVERRYTASAQGLFSFIAYGGSSIGPALVGGLSSALPLNQALCIAVALPLIGTGSALTLTKRDPPAAAHMQ